MPNDFNELNQAPQKQQDKAILDIKDDWSWGQRLAGNIVNALPTVLWAIITIVLLYTFGQNTELVGLQQAFLNIVTPALAYGILSLSAGLTLISWFFPYFNYRKIMQEGSSFEKAACMIFWSSCVIGLSIIIAACV